MQRLSLSVFLATACLLFRLGASVETVLTCGGHVHRLECESGVISVDTAFFGRADTRTCAGGKPREEVTNTACSYSEALTEFRARCNGKKACEINGPVLEENFCPGTFTYLKSTYSCVPAKHHIVCEQSIAHLHCEEGKVIRVLGADFGRRDRTICGFRRNPSLLTRIDCVKPVTNKVAEKCNGQNTCEQMASIAALNVFCPDIYHYLEYAYTCDATQ